MSKGQEVIDYIETLTVRRGTGRGKRFEVLPWEADFLRGVFDGGRQLNALSCPRGNGKTALMGAVVCACIDDRGPFGDVDFFDVVTLARTFDQSALIFKHAVSLLPDARLKGDGRRYRVQDSKQDKGIENMKTGATLTVLAADPAGNQGLGFDLALCDEPREWAAGAEMWDVMRTALGKAEETRIVSIGVMPVDGSEQGKWFVDLFSDPAAYSMRFQANPKADPLRWTSVRKANPSVDHFKPLSDTIRAEIATVKKSGVGLATFKALRLNLGTNPNEEQEMLLSPDAWKQHVDVAPAELPDRVGDCFVGIDLGGSASMTAAAGYWPETGRLEVCAWHPAASFHNKESKEMAARGELLLTPGYVVDVDSFIPWMFDKFGAWPAAIACDRWRDAELRQSILNQADASPEVKRIRIDWRGQGFRDGGEDVRTFMEAVLSGRVRMVENLLIRYALAVSKVAVDPAGNRKLVRMKHGSKGSWNDGLAAAILAVSLGRRMTDRQQGRIGFKYHGKTSRGSGAAA